MPILDVSIVLSQSETLPEGIAHLLADKAGEIFASDPGKTWVRIWPILKSNYAENNTLRINTPHPVFVEILKADSDPEEIRAAEIAALTNAFAQILQRPKENIHALYVPKAIGRIAFGGKLLRTEPQD